MSEEELRLGGLRINPKTNIGSRTNYFNNVKLLKINEKDASPIQVKGLPENPRLTNFSWSPDQTKIAFTHTTLEGVEAWVLDIQNAAAKRLTKARVNANLRYVINWFEDSQAFLVKMVPENKEPLINDESTIPSGPTISVNDGKKSTKQNLPGSFKK